MKPCSPLKSVTGACPLRTFEMSQTENGQLGAPPRVPQVAAALPAKISARSGFFGSSQRKNSWVSTSNWFRSLGCAALRPAMS